MKAILGAAVLSLVASAASIVAASGPTSFLLDRAVLDAAREGGHAAAVLRLRDEADQLLNQRPPSVLDKQIVPASGDKHDYFSLGPYWWPDPAKLDGMPYVRRDGEVNPASRTQSDAAAFSRTCREIETLGTAWFLNRDERYAAKAAEFARTWFLAPATRMNPNFQHAQAIPGITTGRGIGIIEAQNLIWANEGLALIADSARWSETDRAAMRKWNEEFFIWLTTSANGLDEKAWPNNHGSWYDAQVAHLALVIGRKDDARRILREGLVQRLARHIEPDGSQPLELERTRSLSYSIYNLEALLICAKLGELVEVDWWSHSTPDGRDLGAALRFIAPFLDPAKPWIKPEVVATPRSRIAPLLTAYLARRGDAALQTAVGQAPRLNPRRPWRYLDDHASN